MTVGMSNNFGSTTNKEIWKREKKTTNSELQKWTVKAKIWKRQQSNSFSNESEIKEKVNVHVSRNKLP